MLESGFHANGILGVESEESLRFLKSLKELKELRAQIHDAAAYCEKSYLNSEDKAIVVDNTREYLCRAVVTVVDHLGSVSANLERCIQKSDRVDETECRINCLKQKLGSCDQYNHNFTLTKFQWSKDLPRFYSRYILPPPSSSEESSSDSREPYKPTEEKRVGELEFKTDDDMPLFMYTSSNKLSLGTSPRSPLDIASKDITVMPVQDGKSIAPKLIRNPSFQFQDNRKPCGIRRLLQSMHRKSMNEKEFMSFLRKSKKDPSRLLRLKRSAD
ncbi:putative protein ABIL5 [Bienertia sinuspersici]